MIAEQTKPRKTKTDEQASHLHSSVRNTFFQCPRVPFSSQASSFKKFSTADKLQQLIAEVIRYSKVMREKYQMGFVKEVDHVQLEFRRDFWTNTKSLLRFNNQYQLINEKPYFLTVENDTAETTVTGKIDHVIQLLDCDVASVTIEDKPLNMSFGAGEISQVVTQVKSEVDKMESFLGYVPAEYVGLLQNGCIWGAVLRKVERGKVLWTYIEAPRAFEVDNTSKRPIALVSDANCVEIARLIQHAYCIADQILNPEKRAMFHSYSIKEFQDKQDGEEGGEEDESGDGDLPDVDDLSKSIQMSSFRQSESEQHQQQSKNSKSNKKMNTINLCNDDSLCSKNNDYFVLPLTIRNVTLHSVTAI